MTTHIELYNILKYDIYAEFRGGENKMLPDSFAILMCDKDIDENNLRDIVEKISLRRQIKYNSVKMYGDYEKAYMLYDPDKQYVFEMARNKHLNIIWKDEELFGLISFKENTKGDILYYLEESDSNGKDVIEGKIVKLNLKPQYKGRKVMLISNILLDEEEPYSYEHFCFSIK